eukprot:4617311-Prymnesium_polylepis.1
MWPSSPVPVGRIRSPSAGEPFLPTSAKVALTPCALGSLVFRGTCRSGASLSGALGARSGHRLPQHSRPSSATRVLALSVSACARCAERAPWCA